MNVGDNVILQASTPKGFSAWTEFNGVEVTDDMSVRMAKKFERVGWLTSVSESVTKQVEDWNGNLVTVSYVNTTWRTKAD
jgi:hypothetical protein